MKKIIILLLCLFGIHLNMMAQMIDIDNVRYSLSGTSAIVSKYLGGEGTCVIPPQIEYNGLNYSVTKIEWNAFSNSKVTEVKLPETITAIERDAFWRCYNLLKINLPASLKTLEVSAFNSCGSVLDFHKCL